MVITVIDAMNAMGQDWKCSEILRAEVCRLRTDLAAAEQQAADAEEQVERLAAALDETLHAYLLTVRHHERDTEWPRTDDLSGGAEVVRTARAALAALPTREKEGANARQ